MGRQTPTGTGTVQIGGLGTATCLTYEDGVRNILGVPYGRLAKRWTRAVLADSWADGKHDGTKLGPRSHGIPTHEANIDNDLAVPVPDHPAIPRPAPDEKGCLNLSITLPPSPSNSNSNNQRLLPVTVYIHGGGFVFGSGGTANNDGAHFVGYSARRGTPVIYVTINYRLGLGGFLASGAIRDELARDGYSGVGNFALTDQQLALEWVHRYISELGGDPDNVTVIGQSAGACSIGHLMLARGCEGGDSNASRFQRAVLLSGAADTLENWPLDKWEKRYQALLRHFNIPSGPDELENLRQVDEVEVARATEIIDGNDPGVVMYPCADGWFHSPSLVSTEDLIKGPVLLNWKPPRWLKSLMVGDVTQDGIIWRRQLTSKDRTYSWYHGVLSEYTGSPTTAATILTEKYGVGTDLEPGSLELSMSLEAICADVFFKIPAMLMADRASSEASRSGRVPAVYGYHFDRPSTADNVLRGVAHHSVDNIYGHLNALDIMTPEQSALAHRIADDWIEFAVGERDPWERYSYSSSDAGRGDGERTKGGGRWMVYEPDDSWRVKTEAEDEDVRGYERMRWLVDRGLYEAVYKAACVWRATRAPYLSE